MVPLSPAVPPGSLGPFDKGTPFLRVKEQAPPGLTHLSLLIMLRELFGIFEFEFANLQAGVLDSSVWPGLERVGPFFPFCRGKNPCRIYLGNCSVVPRVGSRRVMLLHVCWRTLWQQASRPCDARLLWS